jgi:O-antigen ligase
MTPSSRRMDCALAVLVALDVVVVVAAAGQVPWFIDHGRAWRWIVLAALLIATAAAVVRERALPRSVPRPALAGAAFVGLALLSSAWSVAPASTLARAVGIGVLGLLVAGVAFSMRGRPERVRIVLDGLVAGAVFVALAGFAMFLIDRSAALESATVAYPVRYRGFAGNPDTAPVLLALALPIALAFALGSRGRRRVLHGAACALFVASIGPSASRGALLAALAGAGVVLLLLDWTWRRRVVALGAVLVVAAAMVAVASIPKPLQRTRVARPTFARNADLVFPLEAEPGYRTTRQLFVRSLTTSSGRTNAWRLAAAQARDRVVAGYGFGTEPRVFVDRDPVFYSSRVENAYLATLLEIGLAGLVLLIGTLALVAAPAWRARAVASDRVALAGTGGAFVAGLVLATVQSYLFAVGGTGALPFWLVAALLVALAGQRPVPVGGARGAT